MTAKMLLTLLLQIMNPVDATGEPVDLHEAVCLAEVVFHESRGENIRGQYAVASVTVNRRSHPLYPSTVCGVVNQSSAVNGSRRCAYSWVCRPRTIIQSRNGSVNLGVKAQLESAARVATDVLSGQVPDPTGGATHFHNRTDRPSWARRFKFTGQIGGHYFYRQPSEKA